MAVFRKFSRSIIAACTTVAVFAATPCGAAEIIRPTGVVELFTSQGCSSCPPADRVLAELAKDNKTLTLAWHVDYWDYIGWKDSFARPEYTRRQKEYAVSMGESGVYTPQAVINGRVHVVGSRGNDVSRSLAKLTGGNEGLVVPITASIAGDVLKVGIEALPQAAGTTLWMVYFNNRQAVKIERGELAGQTLDYTSIVGDIEMIGMVGDKPLQADFPVKDMRKRGFDSSALILQKVTSAGTPGAIVGAMLIRNLGK